MKKIDYRKLCHPAHPEFRLAISPFYLMAHADFDYHEDMSTVLEKYGVNRSMYRIMTVLREHESANIGFLAERSLTKRNTASRIVERMVAKELVNAFSNPNDSRITEVTLTQRGKDLLNSLTPIVGRQFQRAIDGIDNEELEHLVLVLQKISGNLSRLPIEAAAEISTEKRIGTARLPAGQAWAASAIGAAGTTAVSRIEVAETESGFSITRRRRTSGPASKPRRPICIFTRATWWARATRRVMNWSLKSILSAAARSRGPSEWVCCLPSAPRCSRSSCAGAWSLPVNSPSIP
jgi:MarR family transcriptional regulator, organic hydroperoxide resistance regulator